MIKTVFLILSVALSISVNGQKKMIKVAKDTTSNIFFNTKKISFYRFNNYKGKVSVWDTLNNEVAFIDTAGQLHVIDSLKTIKVLFKVALNKW